MNFGDDRLGPPPFPIDFAKLAKVHAVNQRPAHQGKQAQQESRRKGTTLALPQLDNLPSYSG